MAAADVGASGGWEASTTTGDDGAAGIVPWAAVAGGLPLRRGRCTAVAPDRETPLASFECSSSCDDARFEGSHSALAVAYAPAPCSAKTNFLNAEEFHCAQYAHIVPNRRRTRREREEGEMLVRVELLVADAERAVKYIETAKK
jgi:hypothetical protein